MVTKNSRTFPGLEKHFPKPCLKPAMFKYRDKQQLLTIYTYSMTVASILQYMFISCKEIAKKLFKQLSQLFTHFSVCVRITA